MSERESGHQDSIDLWEQGAEPSDCPSTLRVRLPDTDALALTKINETADTSGDVLSVQANIEEPNGYELSTTAYVGSIALPSGRVIRIHPKVPESTLIRMLAYTGEPNTKFFQRAIDLQSGETFIDSIARQLERELRNVLRTGLRSDYKQRSETRDAVRGQMNLDRQLQKQGPTPIKFEVDYAAHTVDTLKNQILLRAAELGSKLTNNRGLRGRLRQIKETLAQRGVSKHPISSADTETVQLNRLESHYSSAIDLAKLLIDGTYTESQVEGETGASSFLLYMPTVFEELLRKATGRWFRNNSELQVTKEAIGHLVRGENSNEPLGNPVRPDIVIKKSDTIHGIVDAKWTSSGPKKDHLYQMVAYLAVADIRDGVLIYPTLHDPPDERFITPDRRRIYLVELEEVLTQSGSYLQRDSFADIIETTIGRKLPYDLPTTER